MGFTKYASVEIANVLDLKGSATQRTASLARLSDFDEYRTEDNYLYARIRAISSRVNRNHDGWPSIELAGNQDIFDRHLSSSGGFTVEAQAGAEYGYSTFLGKPIFVDHHNSDPSRARGVIVDAKLHIEDHKTAASLDPYYASAPESHMPPTWVELLLEVDAKSFPRLAKAILDGSKNSKTGIDGFSMGCFVPGTPITLADGTRKPIEEIALGDKVLTHTGKTEPVTYLMKRKHEGVVYQVHTYGEAQTMLLTQEHPVWTKDGWVEAKDLKEDDFVLTPRFAGEGHPGTFTFARLLGYYLAEGNLMFDRKRFADGRPVSVEWNFNANEVEFIEEVKVLLDQFGYRPAGPYIKNNCASIRCNSPELAQRFLDYGGQHSWAKRLHHEVLGWEEANQRALLGAYFNGDGHYRHEGRVEVGTASERLAHQLQLLATRVGYRMTPPVKQHSPSAAKKRPKYSMQATLVKPDPRTEVNAHVDGEGLWRKITKISMKEYDGHVYNFDVEGDDSYVAADIAVHNCDVEKSVCNICKNAATAPDEYCEHIKLKGAEFDYIDPTSGRKTSKKSYEDCYGVRFFEISAVFDPADETALIREVVNKESKLRRKIASPDEALELCNYYIAQGYHPSQAENMVVKQLMDEGMPPQDAYGFLQNNEHLPEPKPALPVGLRPENPTNAERPLYAKHAAVHQADRPLPQADLIKAPEDVDTLRDEQICPVCGSTMDETTCDVCGYVEPPDHFNNPDLDKHKEEEIDVPEEQPFDAVAPGPSDVPPDQSSSMEPPTPRNPQPLSHIKSDMARWQLSVHPKVAGKINPVERPILPSNDEATNEPQEEVLEDHDKPVTSAMRTARQLLASAQRKKENIMRNQHTAAEPVPAAKPDTRGEVDGVGGYIEDSNEAASKAERQIDVTGQGGTGVENVSADKENVEVAQGDEHSKNIEAIPTKTFPDEGQTDPVTGEPFVPSEDGVKKSHDSAPFPTDLPRVGEGQGAAEQGVQPSDAVGTADKRVNVLQPTTTPANNSGATTTWSGTDGNGVLKQQDPVTGESLEGSDGVKKSHLFMAFKLADLEVEMGLLDPTQKYERAAELEAQHPAIVQASLKYAQKVKTAGLSKGGQRIARRLPSLAQPPVRKETKAEDSAVSDDALFL